MKKVMKKIILTLFFLFAVFTLNNVTLSRAESDNANDGYNTYNNEMLEKKIAELQREMYITNLIQYVEFESEVIIPEYLDIKYVEYIYETATKLEIPTRMAFRLVYKESTFRDTVISSAGAGGLMQLMPDTRDTYTEILGLDTMRIDNNQKDILIGLNYLKDLYSFWSERGNQNMISWKLGLASYNAGKGRVLQYRGIPPYKETQDFVAFILKKHSNPEFFANYAKKYDNALKTSS
jgi:soluble lytic murein transglycosylase-like protein